MKCSSNQSISIHSFSQIMQEENQSIDIEMRQGNETQFNQDMQNKLRRLKAFVESLQTESNTLISKQLLEHFQKESQQFTDINGQKIIAETQKKIQKMKKSKKIKKNWSSNDMKVLIWVICKYAQKQSINIADLQSRQDFWQFVSSVIPGTTPQSCLFKWLSQRRYKITMHSWNQSEEILLKLLQEKYKDRKNKWKIISEELYLSNIDADKIFRHPKQCRQHYASFLDPTIVKGPWSKQEDNSLLCYIFFHNGEKKWCKLSKILEGRTENAIKNRYQLLYSKLKRKKENKSRSEVEMISQYLEQNQPEFENKKQREAVKSAKQQKISVDKQKLITQQTIKSNPNIPFIPVNDQVLIKSPRIIIPIVLKHASDFKLCQDLSQQKKQRKNLLICQNGWQLKAEDFFIHKQQK